MVSLKGSVALFDIRLNSTERDVVVFRGPPEEAASVLLTGRVVLSPNDALSFKRITLKIYGSLRMRWMEHAASTRGVSSKSVKYSRTLFEADWPNLQVGSIGLIRAISRSGTTTPGNYVGAGAGSGSGVGSVGTGTGGTGVGAGSIGATGSGSASNTNASNSSSATPLHSSSPSSSNLAGLTHNSHTLAPGNHEFPFEVVLPGDLAESLEGLDTAQVVYKIVATVERGRFAANLVATKHLRVVRTLGSDGFEMHQTVSIENTWPNKVDYTIETPSKAVAVGGVVPVLLRLTPQLKGLKLGQTRVQITELVQLIAPTTPNPHSSEKAVYDMLIPAPEDGFEGQDEWEVSHTVPVPASLARLSQDYSTLTPIRVSHKLKFAVSLLNPDGHVSELRAALPIILYISPNVPISSAGGTDDPLFVSGSPSTSALASSSALTSSDPESNPPNYSDHIYDRLWGDIPASILDSPPTSGATTPHHSLSRRGSFDHDSLGMTGLDPQQRSQLAAGLRALESQQMHWQAQQRGLDLNEPHATHLSNPPSLPHSHPSSYPSSPFAPGSLSTNATADYFSARLASTHLSSSHQSPALSPAAVADDVEALSRVPSYDTAVKAEIGPAAFAPSYSDEPNSRPPSPGRTHSSASLNRANRSASSRSLLEDAAKFMRKKKH